MDNFVTSVLGPIAPEMMGITDAHNHLWIQRQDLAIKTAPVLEDLDLIIEELVQYRKLGGGSQLDCQPGGAGRNAHRLARISNATGIHIIACTGFHLQEYYPEGFKLWALDADQATDYLLKEINLGLEESSQDEPIFPGFIKIAVRETLESSPSALMEAAAAASRESGLLIEMHTQKGSDVERFVEYFIQQDLSPDRLVVCHIDKRPDPGLHKELAEAGFLLEYDTFFREKYHPEINLWPLIMDMVSSGYAGSIACATDLADLSMWNGSGNSPGVPGFISVIKQRLDDSLQDPIIVQKLTGGNIAARLAHYQGDNL
jgi:phosphotriesterase-related protein